MRGVILVFSIFLSFDVYSFDDESLMNESMVYDNLYVDGYDKYSELSKIDVFSVTYLLKSGEPQVKDVDRLMGSFKGFSEALGAKHVGVVVDSRETDEYIKFRNDFPCDKRLFDVFEGFDKIIYSDKHAGYCGYVPIKNETNLINAMNAVKDSLSGDGESFRVEVLVGQVREIFSNSGVYEGNSDFIESFARYVYSRSKF